jgi:HK97 family phage major capsid protein
VEKIFMSYINQLRSERAQVNDAVQALAQIEVQGSPLSTEQLSEFTQWNQRFNQLTSQIERAEAAERLNAAAAVPVDVVKGIAAQSERPTMAAQPKTPEIKGAKMARMVRALVAAQGDPQRAAHLAMERGFGEEVAMSLNTVTPGSGGVLVPQNMSSEVIELLRPKAVVRGLQSTN